MGDLSKADVQRVEEERAAALANEAAFRRQPLTKVTPYADAVGEVRVRIEWLNGRTIIERMATPEEAAAFLAEKGRPGEKP
jgi:hypothetical protein